jgi:hypothetical protein
VVRTDLGSGDYGIDVRIQEDGRLVVAGTSGTGSSTNAIAVVRHATDGTIDVSYGNGGRSLTAPPPNTDLGADAFALGRCSLLTVGIWGYDNNSVAKTAIGIARYHR